MPCVDFPHFPRANSGSSNFVMLRQHALVAQPLNRPFLLCASFSSWNKKIGFLAIVIYFFYDIVLAKIRYSVSRRLLDLNS